MAKLSPGSRWQDKLKLRSIPEVLAWRQWWLKRALANRRVRAGLRECCKHDILWWINLFAWQYNPRAIGAEVGPFWTWPFQDQDFLSLVQAVEDQVNVVSEKSRDMGFSWMYDLLSVWLGLFHPMKKILMISKSEKAVDDEDPDSLFWKIDFIHEHLPEWLVGGEIRRRKLYFGYPSGSTITGESSTGRAGVGGRATMILVDEFAQIKEDFEVLHRTSDTSYCRMFNSTHLGLDTAFYKLCTDRISFPAERWRHIVRHWTDHPKKNRGLYRYDQGKNQIELLDRSDAPPDGYPYRRTVAPVGGPHPGVRSPWYDAACGDKGSARAIAIDLDINPQGSLSQVFDPVKLAALEYDYCVPPYWEGDVLYDPDTGDFQGLVARPGGNLRLWLHLTPEGKVRPSEYKLSWDLSAGTGATNSCGTLIDARLGEKVGSYVTPNQKPDQLAPLGVALCHLFSDDEGRGAEMIWECPGPGLIFSETVLKLGYRRIYYRTQAERTGPRLDARDRADQPGWYQSNDGKRWLLDRYQAALENRKYITRDVDEVRECRQFQWSNDGRTIEHSTERSQDDPSGARLNHGDRVVSAAMGWMLAAEISRVPAARLDPTDPPPNSLAWRRQLWQNEERERNL